MTGVVDLWQPAVGEGIRIDAGIETGSVISPHYDPMVAKVIAWGETRETARHRLINALQDTAVFGSTTNKRFLIDVLRRQTFARGAATTAFIDEEFGDADLADPKPTLRQAAIAAVLQFQVERQHAVDKSLNVSPALLDWSSGGRLLTRYIYVFGDDEMDLTVSPSRRGRYVVHHGDDEVLVDLLERNETSARLTVDGRRRTVMYAAATAGVIDVSVNGRSLHFRNRIAFAATADEAAGGGRVVAPMHGALLEVFVKPGDQVEVGTRLAVLEAMKMQHDILAEVDGTVQDVLAAAGNQVAADDLLIEIEAA